MINYEIAALEYLSKLSDGGMRDAITLLDKCLSYSTDLTLENVVKALGTVDYDIMFNLTENIFYDDNKSVINIIESLHREGLDLKQFIKQYMQFCLDVCKYFLSHEYEYISIPNLYEKELKQIESNKSEVVMMQELVRFLVKLNSDIKWDNNPKYLIEASFLTFGLEE